MKKPLSSYFHVEAVNSLTHALGILFGCFFMPSLIAFSVDRGTMLEALGVSLYGICYLTTFTFSTLYHAARGSRTKRLFELLDHISIYFLIAATYTAFILHYMLNTQGYILLLIVWTLGIGGVLFERFYLNRFIILSVTAYVFMGLLFVFVSRTFFATIPSDVTLLIYGGIALYLLGLIFFLWRQLRHHHALWHLFVLAGSICHFEAIWLSVSR